MGKLIGTRSISEAASPVSADLPRCSYAPFGTVSCGRPIPHGETRCREHANEHCHVCGQPATHDCTGAISSSFCARPVCDECDNYAAGYVHNCSGPGPGTLTIAEKRAQQEARDAELAALEARVREQLAAQRADERAEREVQEYVPDPRNNLDYWTARRVVEEQRPTLTAEGWGGPRRIWASCQRCFAQRAVEPQAIMDAGKGDIPLGELHLRCKCGGSGHAKLTWANAPRVRERRGNSMPVPGKPRPGSFDFAERMKRGAWD